MNKHRTEKSSIPYIPRMLAASVRGLCFSLHYVLNSFAVSTIVLSMFPLSWCYAGPTATSSSAKKWVGTWSTAPQLVETGNMPPAPGLTNNSLRQVIRVSIGGDTLRVRFSNEFSTSVVTMKSVQIAVSTGSSSIDVSTNKELKFNGNSEGIMNAGAAITSDPIAFNLMPRKDLAITIYYGQTSTTVTGHPGSRTTSYIISGNTTTKTDFTGAVTTDHWYNINTIDVLVPSAAACVAILGNSITDGRGSTTNLQDRWPDVFSESLLKDSTTRNVAVLNMGIGGNCVLSGGLGPTGVSRFDRDVLSQSGIRWAIVFEGVNDIGGVSTSPAATATANNLIDAYRQMIVKAHAKGITIYGATITPFKGNAYFNQYSESCRNTVNQWIRTRGNYDGCIDFDKVMRSTLDTTRLVSTYQNDGLHPDAAGYKTMGESIDLNLFTGDLSTGMNDNSEHLPGTLSILQNYPNPFNPSTKIQFGIPNSSFVSLKVFNVLGSEIASLVNENKAAGIYQVIWDANGYPSGVYLYRLLSGGRVLSGKMNLLK
jgi:lysophospholipase L1-like esterase